MTMAQTRPLMEPYEINPAIAAFMYALAAVFSKRALQLHMGILRLSLIINLGFIAVFSTLLFGEDLKLDWSQIHLPVLAGILFFLGQIFTLAAIRIGDVSLQTPVMGSKAVFVVLIAIVLGTEELSNSTILAAFISMIAVALLGFSGGGAERVGLTLIIALLSSLFFAGADVMVAAYGQAYGPKSFIFIIVLINGLLSFGMIPFFRQPIRAIPTKAWPWALLATLGMGGQALLLNYTLAQYQNAAAFNIIYSSRGLWSVALAAPVALLFAFPYESTTKRIKIQRLTGALLMTAAIALVFT